MKPRDALANALLLAAGIAVAGAIAEVVCRTVYPLQTITTRLDPHLIYERIPGSRELFVRTALNGGETIMVRYNSLGYRGPEPAGGMRRVVVYGDSYVEAAYSSEQAAFPAQVERELRALGHRDVEVLNGGVSGYGPDQALRRAVRDHPVVRPSLVVLAIFSGNDFGDLVRNKLYFVDAQGRLAAGAVEPSADIVERYESARRKSERLKLGVLVQASWKAAWNSFKRRDQAVAAKREDVRSWLLERSSEHDAALADRRTVTNLFNDGYDADIAVAPGSRSARDKIALMSAVLGRLSSELRALGAPLAVVVIPSPVDACSGYDWQVDPGEFPEYGRGRLNAAAVQAAASAALPVLDLMPAFAGEDCGALYFHGGDQHWNDAGQARAAGVTARFLASQRLLAPAPPQGMRQ